MISYTIHHANNHRADDVVQDVAAGEAVSKAVGSYSHRFSCATLSLVPPASTAVAAGDGVLGQCLPELLLMSHHPAITAGVADKQATWRVAVGRLQGTVAAALEGK